MARKSDLLQNLPLFRNLSPSDLERLEPSLEEVEVKAGRHVFKRGDASDCFYAILAGKISVEISAESSENPEYRDLGPGQFFGEIGMLRGSRRTADAVAAESSRLLKVDKLGFDSMMSEDPLFADTVMEVTRARLAELEANAVKLDFDRGQDESGRVVVFFSPRGGAGTTFLAANFAKKVRDLSKKRVVLFDADLEFGACHVLVDQRSQNRLADAIASSGSETVSPMDVQETLIDLPQGFALFPAPARTEDAMRFGPSHVRSIVEELQRAYDYVVVDTRSTLSDATLTVFEMADDVLCVMENDIISITRTIRCLDLLGRAGFDTERFRIVLNKVSSFGYSPEEIERDLKREICFRVEVDVKPVMESINAGKLLVDERKGSRAAIDVMNGARGYLLPYGDVKDISADRPAPVTKEERGFSLWNLFFRGSNPRPSGG